MELKDIFQQLKSLLGKRVKAEGILYHYQATAPKISPEWYMASQMPPVSSEFVLTLIAPDPDHKQGEAYFQKLLAEGKKRFDIEQQAFEQTVKKLANFVLSEDQIRSLWYQLVSGSKEALEKLRNAGILEEIFRAKNPSTPPDLEPEFLRWMDFKPKQIIRGSLFPPYELYSGIVLGTVVEQEYQGRQITGLTNITELIITEGNYTRYMRNKGNKWSDISDTEITVSVLDIIQNPADFHYRDVVYPQFNGVTAAQAAIVTGAA